MKARRMALVGTMLGIAIGSGGCDVATVDEELDETDVLAATGDPGWYQSCKFVKSGNFDPIVYPNQPPPAGHRHVFFGSTAVSYDSTLEDLRAGGTTCHFNTTRADDNKSSYWAPDLFTRDGRFAGGVYMNVYYKLDGADPDLVEPFPAGLKMIARDGVGTRAYWQCSGAPNSRTEARDAPYDCDPNSTAYLVTATIQFPRCGDGRTDSPDHMSHMAYQNRDGSCPASHPHVYPRIAWKVKYNTWKGVGARLASTDPGGEDPATNYHADYFEGWGLRAIQDAIDTCIKAGQNCISRIE